MKTGKKDPLRPPHDAVWFCSLGGSGEIGMNLSLYGTDGSWIMVDCGITFGDESTPGVEIIMPDISFIAERSEQLAGLIITHGHEDHIGAIEHLWPRLQCPIYATPFTAELIRSKCARSERASKVRIIEIPLGGSFRVGPFEAEMVNVTHSIPEAHMVLLKTPHGQILHTGDWKLDPQPLVGPLTNSSRLQEIGREGVMALIGDSTNALVPGRSGSEADVQTEFKKLFSKIKHRIIVTCFASNIARLKSITETAQSEGRYVSLVGRSLWRNGAIAEATGYLPEFRDYLTENEAALSPRDKIVIICTGCQGEPRSALWRMAVEDHPEVEIQAGDTVIFSSRDIPGNEKTIALLQNKLTARGCHLITLADHPIHVSGHPAQDELADLYQWVRPKLILPVHGEARHQLEHTRIAKECQIPHALIPKNGEIIRLGPGVHEVVATVPSGRVALDGKIIRPLNDEASKERKKMSYHGMIALTLVMDQKGKVVQDPHLSMLGLFDPSDEAEFCDELFGVIEGAISGMAKSSRTDDQAVRHHVALAVRRLCQENLGKKPLTEVHVIRV